MIKITNDVPNGELFNIFLNNALLKRIEDKMLDKKDAAFVFKSMRLGILGQTLLNESNEIISKDDRVHLESIGMLTELYIYYIRSLYDYLLRFLDEKLFDNGNRPRSFKKFIDQLKKGQHLNISRDLKESLIKNELSFEELRDARDSIKEKTSVAYAYINENKLRIKINVYGRDKADKGFIDKELSEFIFSLAISIWCVMMFILWEEGKK